MKEAILMKLAELEKRLDIVVLYCVDVGKRALGNQREEQPYEVKFIYRRNVNAYIRVDEEKQDLDIRELEGAYLIGRDIKQFLKRMYEGNVEPFEWLSSPMIYRETPYIQEIRKMMPQYFSEEYSFRIYTKQVLYRGLDYLKMESVAVEYYWMLILPMLKCKWILVYHTIPPFTFEELVTCLQDEDEVIRQAFDRLIGYMQTRRDQEVISREKMIDEYMLQQFKKIAAGANNLPRHQEKPWQPLNEIFEKAFEENGHTNP